LPTIAKITGLDCKISSFEYQLEKLKSPVDKVIFIVRPQKQTVKPGACIEHQPFGGYMHCGLANESGYLGT
jgi:hypothetical protein